MAQYRVHMNSKDVVVPLLPLQHQTLPLSNIDLTLPPFSFHPFLCYNNPSKIPFSSMLTRLKSSLSRAFLHFYVLAGRLVKNSAGEMELHCNNKGAELFQAYATIALSQLNFYNPDESFQGKLIVDLPKTTQDDNGTPVFAVQVTMFSCGGIVVGCTFDHKIADGYSADMFLKYWAKLSRNESIESLQPSFTRSILCPRDPPIYCSEVEKMYVKWPSLPSQESSQQTPRASRIYYIDAKRVENLQISASKNGTKCSKYEAFCAYLWKLLMTAKEVEDTMMSGLGVVVDGRPSLMKMGMSPNQFGNVILLPFAEASAGHIKKEPLSWAAKLVQGAIRSAVDAEQFQGLIDLVETFRPASTLPKIYYKRDSVLVSSGLRFGLYEVDYGWGKPKFAGLHFPWGGEAGYVYVMPMVSQWSDGGWVVYMHLPSHYIHAIESNSQGVLRPITKAFLGFWEASY